MIAAWLVALSACTATSSPENPAAWVWFEPRESAGGPRLVVESKAGARRELTAVADTVLIAYLADRAWGALDQLSLSRNDTNRVLLQFDLAGVEGIERAELVLALHLSAMPPRDAFGVGLHPVTAAWKEGGASWNAAPAFEPEPAAMLRVEPKAGELRVDVTALARAWAAGERPNHGLLLKVAEPLAVGDPSALEAAKKGLFDGLSLAESVERALERAKTEKKPILAVVVGTWNAGEIGAHEEHLFGIALAHPAVRALVAARFVIVKVACTPNEYVIAIGGAGSADPLKPLGARLGEVKPPALVVTRGEKAAVLESIGTFGHELVLRFLLAALPPEGSGPPAKADADTWALLDAGRLDAAEARFAKAGGAEGELGRAAVADRRGKHDEALKYARAALSKPGEHTGRAATRAGVALARLGRLDEARAELAKAGADEEAVYHRAVLDAFGGEKERAKASFTALAADAASRWAPLARAWRAWPERMRMHVAPIAPALAGASDAAEVAVRGAEAEQRLVELAAGYLALVQNSDGSWPLGDAAVEDYRAGVTALAAHALFAWRDELGEAAKARAAAALARSDRWLAGQVAKADPASLNSFGAAYWLDYQLARHARGVATAEEVQAAVDLVLGGRMSNGAWAYSKGFGEGWKGGFAGWPATTKGRAHSMNTGLSLEVLARAKAAGAKPDAELLAASVKTMLTMRVKPGAFTYTWPEPLCFETEDASIARASVCELALWRLGATPKADLQQTLALYVEHETALRLPVKLSASWLAPHGFSSYFWFFAHFHAAQASIAVGDERSKRILARIREEVLSVVEPDGTWVDFEGTGKPYGTAMALLLLKMTAPQSR